MKIAISSQGQDMNSEVDPRFGRASFFLVVDTDTGDFEAVANEQILNAPQGAGIQAASTVSRTGASAVLTGHCGPNAFRTLSAGKIEIYTGVSGTVAEAVAAFKKGALKKVEGPDVEGHWV